MARASRDGQHSDVSLYDKIAHLYDPWSASVVEDIEFYVEEAQRSGGPVVELAVGTGRIAVPIASAGIDVIGVDSSDGMLAVAREAAAAAGVEVDLRLGDLREPPVEGTYPLVIVAFRSLLHMETEADRRAALRAVHAAARAGRPLRLRRLRSGARRHQRDARPLARARPGIFERADWDEDERRLVLSVRGRGAETSLSLAWVSVAEWRVLLAEEGFAVEGLYGWFDRRPWAGHEDSIWVCRRD